MIKKLILTKPKLVLDCKCPKCRSIKIQAVDKIPMVCSDCNTRFMSNIDINIYYSVAKQLEHWLADNQVEGVQIVCERDNSDTTNPTELMRARNKFYDELWHAIVAIQQLKRNQRCWEVSEIEQDYDHEYSIRCLNCGVCCNCVTCAACGEHYVPKTVHGKHKKYACPKCASKEYKTTHIRGFKDNKYLCPYCDSDDTLLTQLPSTKKACPRCKSNKLTSPKNISIYKLLIAKQKRFLK